MLQTLKLLLPALIPSWRFFDTVAPSPRIEFTRLENEEATSNNWQELRPKPSKLSVGHMLKRLFWNANWNETLFLVSCAERLMVNPTEHSAQEILKCIKSELEHNSVDMSETPYLQFRLVFLSRQGTEIQKEITFISRIYQYSGSADK